MRENESLHLRILALDPIEMPDERIELGGRFEVVLEEQDGSVRFRRRLGSPSWFGVLVVVVVLVLDDLNCSTRSLTRLYDILRGSRLIADGAASLLPLIDTLFDAGDQAG